MFATSSQAPLNSTLAIAHLPPGEVSNSLLGTVHLPSEGTSSPQANSQASIGLPTLAIAHLPPREVSNSLPGAALLPSGEDNSSTQATVLLPSGEGNNSSQAVSLLPHREGDSSLQSSRSTQAGQGSNPTRPSRQGSKHPPRHRSTQSPQEVSTTSWEGNPSSTHPSRSPQSSSNEEPNPKWVINLSNKPLTPAQRSVLAKGPNFVVTPRQPPNLEYITAIEAACTKLSQQDAEELRANINRVLRSSHPPNPT